VARGVVGLGHQDEDSPLDDDEDENVPLDVSLSTVKRIALSVLVCSVGTLAVGALLLPVGQALLLAPVVLALVAALFTLLAVRSRQRAVGDEP
jgi:hypothetical protein